MALITGGGTFPIRMDQLSFYNLFSGTIAAVSSDYLRVEFDSSSYFELYGSGVGYSSSGSPVSGVITGMREVTFGQEVYKVSGFSISAPYFYSLAINGQTTMAKEAVLSGSDAAFGTSLADYLETFAGNDLINGGGGADIMIGGRGNDTYYVSSRSDDVRELFGQGKDTVITSVSYALDANVENLKTINASAKTKMNLTGNDLRNVITGNAGANKIEGGGGNDVLTGGKGRDTFIFDTDDTGYDFIKDFSVRDDTIAIRDFMDDMPKGALSPSAFAIGGATTSNPTVVYDPSSGGIWYAADGNSPWGETQYLGRVKAWTPLTAADFVFI